MTNLFGYWLVLLRGNRVASLQQICHPDRSVPGFAATLRWIRLRVCLSVKAHEVCQRHQVPQEIRGSVVEGSAVRFSLSCKHFSQPKAD
jgi:hypothetical protein